MERKAAMSEDRLDLSSDPEFIRDPYATLDRLREEEPVRRVRYHGVPAWLVTRFADAEMVYSDPRLSADKANASDEARAVPWVVASDMIGLGKTIVFADPPAHTRMRRLVSRAFTPRRVATLRPMVQGIADQLLDAIVPRGRADILHELSTPLAAQAIMVLLGAPLTDREEFTSYSHTFLSTDPADQARVPEAMAWMATYIAGLVAAKAETPADDLLSELIAVRDGGGDRLSEAELRSMALLLLMAGFETTASFIPNGLLALLQHPEQMKALREDPSLIPSAVEEMLRYDPTATASLLRYAAEDLTLGGADIRKSDAVVVSWAAANRDPRRFAEPDTFDVRRGDASHIAFAHGIHYCLGAPLARLESQIAFASLLARCWDIQLAIPFEELSYRVTPNIRSLKELPVTFTPAP
jgi:cytochrome P450